MSELSQLILTLTPFIGMIGGILGIVVYFPQIIKIHRTKHSVDVAAGTYWVLFLIGLFWSIYGVLVSNPIIYVPNIVDIFLPLYVLGLKRRYG